MSREIKFRAWNEDDKKMFFVSELRWAYDGTFISGLDTIFGADHWVPGDNSSINIMQYTGLKDNHDKEVFEGDIIKIKNEDGLYDYGEVVYGRKAAFCLWLPQVMTGIRVPLLNYVHGIMIDDYDIEVLGNIYENPELIGDNND